MGSAMKMLVTTQLQRDPTRLAQLGQEYDVQFVLPGQGEATAPLMADIDAVYGHITLDDLSSAKQLRWVQAGSAGVEWVWRVPGLADAGIVVTNMRGAHAATIAEHTFGLLLFQTRGLGHFQQRQQQHEWHWFERQLTGIKGLTMGVVGFGNIGRAIARRASGFEMPVLAVDAEPVPPGEGVEQVWPLARLDELCAAADVLSIAAPITPSSRGMIGRDQIRRLKRGSYIMQMSRGGIVDEPALIDALEEGHLAGAGMDVTATEPLPVGDPLWTAPNLLITPHTSAISKLTSELNWSILSQNLGRFQRGQELINQVDIRRGW
jgi:D-3-phosphoglycerate dehydrogenase